MKKYINNEKSVLCFKDKKGDRRVSPGEVFETDNEKLIKLYKGVKLVDGKEESKKKDLELDALRKVKEEASKETGIANARVKELEEESKKKDLELDALRKEVEELKKKKV